MKGACGKDLVEKRLKKFEIKFEEMLHFRIPQYGYRHSWRSPMEINGGESLKHKPSAEIRFQEEIYRVDQ